MNEQTHTFPAFDDLIKELEERLEPVENRRLRYRNLNIFLGIVYLGGLMAISWYLFRSYPYVLIPLYLIVVDFLRRNFRNLFISDKSDTGEKYKQQVIRLFVERCIPGGALIPKQGIAENYFRESRLFTYGNVYQSEDMITGNCMGQQICFSDVRTQDKQIERGYKGSKVEKIKTLFRGLFYMTDCPDAPSTDIQICAHNWPKNYGSPVTVEDWEFKQRFKVYATDQEAALSYFTADRIKNIIALHDRLGKNEIGISFIESKLYVAVHYKRDMFEVNPFQSVYKRVKLEEDFNIICSFANILPILFPYPYQERR